MLLDKRIAVTGGNGFLGRHVIAALNDRGIASNQIYVPNYDLRVTSNVGRMYFEFRPDIVIHLAAACGGLGANIVQPGKFFYDNMKMGIELMETGRRYGLEKFVQIGTICAYPKVTAVPFREDDLWLGYPEETNAPYGIAKKALLVMAQAYRQQYGFNVIYLMPTNLYGPGDDFSSTRSHVLPALIKKFEEAKNTNANSVSVWGTGNATRDFLYVKDAAKGIILATERYNESVPVNLGSGVETSIRTLVEETKRMMGFKGRIIWDSTKPDGQIRRVLDPSRAAVCFGFKAKTNLLDGIEQTIRWYETQCVK